MNLFTNIVGITKAAMLKASARSAQQVTDQINEKAPRTRVDPNIMQSVRERLKNTPDDLSGGVVTNNRGSLMSKFYKYVNGVPVYSQFQRYTNQGRPTDPIQYFKGRGVYSRNDKVEPDAEGYIYPDRYRATLLGDTDYARQVVQYSGRNAMHNRLDNLSDKQKVRLGKAMDRYGVDAPHRTAIQLNATSSEPGKNTLLPYAVNKPNFILDNPDMRKASLENGIFTFYTPEIEGDEDYAGFYDSTGSSTNNGLNNLLGTAPPGIVVPTDKDGVGEYSAFWDKPDKTYFDISGEPLSRSEDGSYFRFAGDGMPIKTMRVPELPPELRIIGGHTGTWLHEPNHHESSVSDESLNTEDQTGSYYGNSDISRQLIGFDNPEKSYPGAAPAETVRAIQSGKLPVTKMYMDKVERIANDVIPGYSGMSPKDQLDIRSQIVAELAEDPAMALDTYKRWNIFNPGIESGTLNYYVPLKYLTDDPDTNSEILDSIYGLHKARINEKTDNPRWRKFYDLIYPQQIGSNQNEADNTMA